ncbi:MAG: hypothetical protein JNK60_22745, partial [Acidobacteria bacterium]|nr:hypothetical protein [Acidobacteriota bacterium]
KISVLPPDVNVSDLYFTPDNGAIRFGLGAVKGVGEGAVSSILTARTADGPFVSFTDLCCRIDLRLNNRKVLETLIRSGAFDRFGRSRASLSAGLDTAIDIASAERDAAASTQSLLFDEPISKDHADSFPELPEWPFEEKIQHEKETLGFFLTGHPLERWADELALFGDVTAETAHEHVDENVRIVGLVGAIKKNQIKKGQNEGKTMAKLTLDDLTGSVPVTVFASLYEKVAGWLEGGRPILVSGIVRAAMAPGASDGSEEGAPVQVEIIAKEIQQLDGIREEKTREIRLMAPLAETTDETFLGVKRLLESSPGSTPVSLAVTKPGGYEARFNLPSKYAVRPSTALTDGLEKLLGPRSVRYVYA